MNNYLIQLMGKKYSLIKKHLQNEDLEKDLQYFITNLEYQSFKYIIKNNIWN